MIALIPCDAHDDLQRRPSQGGAGRPLLDPGRSPRNPFVRAAVPCGRARRLGQLATSLGLAHVRRNAAAVWLGLSLALAAAPLHAAQPQPAQASASDEAVTVGQVTINGHRQGACPQAPRGDHRPNLACLNQELQAAAKAGDPPPPATSAEVRDAEVPSKAGTFSQTATAERLGKNFGKSAQPYRPPAPAYSNPVMPGKPR